MLDSDGNTWMFGSFLIIWHYVPDKSENSDTQRHYSFPSKLILLIMLITGQCALHWYCDSSWVGQALPIQVPPSRNYGDRRAHRVVGFTCAR